MEPTAFSEATSLAPLSSGQSLPTGELGASGQFEGDVHAEWTIAGKPNGGYLLAMLGRAAAKVGSHPHPIAASAHYLHSPDPGPVVIESEVLRAGRSASQLRARMSQGSRVCVEALLTMSTLSSEAVPYWSAGVPDPGTATFEDSVRVPPVAPGGFQVAIMGQVDLRLEQRSLGFAKGKPSGSGELHGWLELPHGEAFDPVSLLYSVDAFPPATFEIAQSGWVPTLELTVYVRAVPAPGPVRVLHKAHLIDAQRVDEVCWIWDSTGRLVAHGTQLAGIRLS